jgi:hypothetical protein
MFVLFPAAEGVRWLVSLPEDETVLTVVRGVVVSVELIRPGRRRFWRHEVEDLSAPIIQQEIFGPVPTSEVFDDEKDPGGETFRLPLTPGPRRSPPDVARTPPSRIVCPSRQDGRPVLAGSHRA